MGVYKDLNDYEIVYLVSENNEEAREVLFDKYYPIIINLANKYKTQAKRYGLDIDDLIQEGYFGLFSAINCYDPNKDTMFYTYVLLSIKSKMLNALRSASNKKNASLNDSVSLFRKIDPNKEAILFDFISDNKTLYPEDFVSNREIEVLIKDFLFSLSISNAAIYELKYNGFSAKDISQLLGISLKYVFNSITRTNKKAKNFFIKNKKYNYN